MGSGCDVSAQTKINPNNTGRLDINISTADNDLPLPSHMRHVCDHRQDQTKGFHLVNAQINSHHLEKDCLAFQISDSMAQGNCEIWI